MDEARRPNSDEVYEQEQDHGKGELTAADIEADEPMAPKPPITVDYRLSEKKRQRAAAAAQVTDPMEKETSLFCPWVRVKRGFKMKVVTGLLVVSVFTERYCFVVQVYKTKYFGYLLILFVIFLNMIFQSLQASIRKDKQKRMLHQQFELERTPKVGIFVICILGLLDMFYAYFLFWPANEISPLLLLTLLQVFIPLNMIFGRCFSSIQYYKLHLLAGLVIIAGVAVNMISLSQQSQFN